MMHPLPPPHHPTPHTASWALRLMPGEADKFIPGCMGTCVPSTLAFARTPERPFLYACLDGFYTGHTLRRHEFNMDFRQE